MKTLKLQLLAASMFACTAAFAQGAPKGAPDLGTAGPNAKAAGFATRPGSNSASFDSNRDNFYVNDSYVLQQGTDQYANVTQSGGTGRPSNQADIIQGPNGGGNNAVQNQTYNGAGGAVKNVAYINQNGLDGTATQIQKGSSNTASIQQGNDGQSQGNTAYQNQQGDQNRAGISQTNGSLDQAIQFQTGKENYSTIDQNGGSPSRAESNQQGDRNAAIITQR